MGRRKLSRFDLFVFHGLAGFAALCLTLFMVAGIGGVVLFRHYTKDLPDFSQLAGYDPPIMTRLYAGDGRLMAEYATEKRIYVPLSAMPRRLINAFLSAEDKNFYRHTGLDIVSLARAAVTNLNNMGQGKSLVGGSTITQQVVKNFLLTNEKSLDRKIKEAILAIRISQAYSKDRILELYLNDIYLGLGSYGVAAAALNYFNKSLDDLSIEEAALLAAMPKAPANYNPKKSYAAAKERRDWVIVRMLEDGHVTREEARKAADMPITLRARDSAEVVHAGFFAEEIRRKLAEMYGANVLYEGGLTVKATLDPALQEIADRALQRTLMEYDRRKGWRGPLKRMGDVSAAKAELAKMASEPIPLVDGQKLAVVASLDEKMAHLAFADGSGGVIPLATLAWARRPRGEGAVGPEIKKPADALAAGDIVIAGHAPAPEPKEKPKGQKEAKEERLADEVYELIQVPLVNGALVALDPHTGRVLALSGGYSDSVTEFNRATQARRQPGSAFKPFVYLAGLENGLNPSTILLDAPVEMSQGAGLPAWKPQNYKDEYLGPTTLRIGLEKSRNTMTVRLAQMIGIDRVLEVGRRFGIYDKPPRNFSIVLGASETTVLKLTAAYAMLVNGGKRIEPSLIERIDDRHGKIAYRRDRRECKGCLVASPDLPKDALPPIPGDDREQMVDPRVAYQMVSMMQGVIERGTATRARVLARPLGGKTGTTNDSLDTWFLGFSPDLAVGVYVGYDKPRSLGSRETGGSVALPGFVSFMRDALADTPPTPFRVPPGIRLVRVDLHTGQPPEFDFEGEAKLIQEAFVTGPPLFLPESARTLARRGGGPGDPASAFLVNGESVDGQPAYQVITDPARPPVEGTGGLY